MLSASARRAARLELQPRDDHARHPEENDVRPGDEHVGRIKFGPRLRRPSSRTPTTTRKTRCRACRGPGSSPRRANRSARGFPRPARTTPGYPVAPPHLPADAPVLNVLQPLRVNLFPVLREEADQPIAHHRQRFGGFRVAQEPLLAQARFDDRLRAFAHAHVVFVRLPPS